MFNLSGTVVNTDKSSRIIIPDGAEELRDWLEVSDVQIDYLIFLQLKNFFFKPGKKRKKTTDKERLSWKSHCPCSDSPLPRPGQPRRVHSQVGAASLRCAALRCLRCCLSCLSAKALALLCVAVSQCAVCQLCAH